MAMAITFKPIFHREGPGHAGPVWHLIGDPDDPTVQAEQRRLIAEGGVVVQSAGQPGTGFVQPAEKARDFWFAAIFLAFFGAIWVVIVAVVALAHTRPTYAALLALGAFPVALAGILHAGMPPAAQRSDANSEKPNRK